MYGAILGDIIGSAYEFQNLKTKDFELFPEKAHFTDDTVLTVATADCILYEKPFAETYKQYAQKYPQAGYGGKFLIWAFAKDTEPYNSFGNGSAMRASPVGYAYDTKEEVLEQAKKSAEVTHNHPEGIKGAQAVALSVFLARTGSSKKEIKEVVEQELGYDLSRSLDDIRDGYRYDVTCQGSVPESIIALLESESTEDAIRNAISLGGDADTMGCIAGAIGEAFYGDVSEALKEKINTYLDDDQKDVVEEFCVKYVQDS